MHGGKDRLGLRGGWRRRRPRGSDRKRSDAGGAREWGEAVDGRCVTFLQCGKVAASKRVAARNGTSSAGRMIGCGVPAHALWVLVKTEREGRSSARICYWGRVGAQTRARLREHGGACSMPRLGWGVAASDTRRLRESASLTSVGGARCVAGVCGAIRRRPGWRAR